MKHELLLAWAFLLVTREARADDERNAPSSEPRSEPRNEPRSEARSEAPLAARKEEHEPLALSLRAGAHGRLLYGIPIVGADMHVGMLFPSSSGVRGAAHLGFTYGVTEAGNTVLLPRVGANVELRLSRVLAISPGARMGYFLMPRASADGELLYVPGMGLAIDFEVDLLSTAGTTIGLVLEPFVEGYLRNGKNRASTGESNDVLPLAATYGATLGPVVRFDIADK